MSSESWFKIALPALPFAFVIFGVGLYWGDNPLPLLPPSLAFWGVNILFYLYTHLYIPERRLTFILTAGVAALWLVSGITAHNLATFIGSTHYSGFVSVLVTRDFWYAYMCAFLCCSVGLFHFWRYEPLIVEQVKMDREAIQSPKG
jgi:hypothetical protein